MTTTALVIIFLIIIVAFPVCTIFILLIIDAIDCIKDNIRKKYFCKEMVNQPKLKHLYDELKYREAEWNEAEKNLSDNERDINDMVDDYNVRYLPFNERTEWEKCLESLRVKHKELALIEDTASFDYAMAREEFLCYCDEKGIKLPENP